MNKYLVYLDNVPNTIQVEADSFVLNNDTLEFITGEDTVAVFDFNKIIGVAKQKLVLEPRT